MRLLFLAVVLAHAAGCAMKSSTGEDPYTRGFAAGRSEAEAQLASGAPIWYRPIGPEVPPEGSGIDPQTGLPWRAVAADSDDSMGRLAGHNQALASYIRQFGLPESRSIKWRNLVNDPASAFATSQPVDSLAPGSSPVYTLDRSVGLTWQRGRSGELRIIRDGRVVARLPPPEPGLTRLDVRWGPEGSELALVRWQGTGPNTGYASIDLQAGLWLVIRPGHQHNNATTTPAL